METRFNRYDNLDELPIELKEYIEFIEREVEVPIKIVSGPDRKQTS
jgi:adenylosuccinate synthase